MGAVMLPREQAKSGFRGGRPSGHEMLNDVWNERRCRESRIAHLRVGAAVGARPCDLAVRDVAAIGVFVFSVLSAAMDARDIAKWP